MRAARFAVALLLVSTAAYGDVPADASANQRMGRDLFNRGVKAAKGEDWAGAERYFTQAYAVYPRPTILGSLAGAQAKAGHITLAVASYRRLLQEPGNLSPAELSAFKAGAAATEARLAWVRVDIVGPRDGDAVLIDDTRMNAADLNVETPIDPGAHSLKLVRDSASTSLTVTFSDGEHRRVTLAPTLAPPPPPVHTEEKKKTIFSSPWFWTVAGVVVAGGTVAVLCVASFCRSDDGFQGNLGSIKLR